MIRLVSKVLFLHDNPSRRAYARCVVGPAVCFMWLGVRAGAGGGAGAQTGGCEPMQVSTLERRFERPAPEGGVFTLRFCRLFAPSIRLCRWKPSQGRRLSGHDRPVLIAGAGVSPESTPSILPDWGFPTVPFLGALTCLSSPPISPLQGRS